MSLRRFLPMAVAILFGFLTLASLLLPLPSISSTILGWAAFLAAVALVLGVFNLFMVHVSRMIYGRNLYSAVLLLSMLAVFALAVIDYPQIHNIIFLWILTPLEAALAALMAIFLLMASFRLLKRRPNFGSLLFLLAAILVLSSTALPGLSSFLPGTVRDFLVQLNQSSQTLFATAGMRGILIGVALGTITLAVRLLVGSEQPYNK